MLLCRVTPGLYHCMHCCGTCYGLTCKACLIRSVVTVSKPKPITVVF